MNQSRFTNMHIHIFNAECAPHNFLRIIRSNLLRRFPKIAKSIIEHKWTRTRIRKLANLFAKYQKHKRRSNLAKYIAFLNVGIKYNQIEIFREAFEVARKYSPNARLVGLTLDMDNMDDSGKPAKNFNTQLREVKQIKKYYPDNFFPFVGIDPRSRADEPLLIWAKKFFENGIKSPTTGKIYPFFSGLKIYPALGFFPFDPKLEPIFAYAEENAIPIMAHCTRGGSQYIGRSIESLIPPQPSMMLPSQANSEAYNKALENQEVIYQRIKRYYEKEIIKNSDIGDNDLACDLFGHPQNYVPVLLKYPKLKICLAHMGGSDEMITRTTREQKLIKTIDEHNWSVLTRDLMRDHTNLFTDISYSLTHLTHPEVKKAICSWLEMEDVNQQKLGNRVLFGTDFYMTERETWETELYELARKELSSWFDRISGINCDRFLYIPRVQPS